MLGFWSFGVLGFLGFRVSGFLNPRPEALNHCEDVISFNTTMAASARGQQWQLSLKILDDLPQHLACSRWMPTQSTAFLTGSLYKDEGIRYPI